MIFILIQLLYAGINVAIADYQAHLFARGKSINHFWWGTAMAAVAGVTWFPLHSWELILLLLLQRLVVFNTSLNLIRHKPFFYLGTASWMDRKLSKIYIPVFIVSCAAIVALQFLL